MTDQAIRNLLNQGHDAEYIANYGQCSMHQIKTVINSPGGTIAELKARVTLDHVKEWAADPEKTAWFCEYSEMSVNDRGFDQRQDMLEDYMTPLAEKHGWAIENR